MSRGARSHCRFARLLIRYIPDVLAYFGADIPEATMRPNPRYAAVLVTVDQQVCPVPGQRHHSRLSSPLISSHHLITHLISSSPLISPRLASSHLTSPHLTSPHLTILITSLLLSSPFLTSHNYLKSPLLTSSPRQVPGNRWRTTGDRGWVTAMGK